MRKEGDNTFYLKSRHSVSVFKLIIDVEQSKIFVYREILASPICSAVVTVRGRGRVRGNQGGVESRVLFLFIFVYLFIFYYFISFAFTIPKEKKENKTVSEAILPVNM